MNKVETVQLGNLTIEGYSGDYVFETIKKSQDFYETDILRAWLPLLQNSRVILDIGANLGNHTLFWASTIPYKKIISFEPLLANYERLSSNISNNHLKNILAINKGVGDQNGFSSIEGIDYSNYGATSLKKSVGAFGDVPIVTIDSFCKDNSISSVDFVKIDTEGFEEQVLDGMGEVLRKKLPDLWIEVSSNSFGKIMDRLVGMGYVLTDVSGLNMLFLHPKRHDVLDAIPIEKVLKYDFYNLERVNLYYKNYLTTKDQLSKKNQRMEEEKIQMARLNGQLEEARLSAKRVEDKLKEEKKQLPYLNGQLEEAHLAVERVENKLEEEKNRSSQMNNQLREAHLSVKRLEDELEEEKNRSNHLSGQLKEARLSIRRTEDELEKEIKQSSIAANQSREIISSQQKTIADYKQWYQDAMSRLASCLQDYDLAIKEVEQYSKEREQNIKEIEQYSKEKEQHSKERERYSKEKEQLSKKNKRLETDYNRLRGKIDTIKKYKLGRLAIKVFNNYQRNLKKRV